MYNEGSLGSVCNVLLFLNKSFFFIFLFCTQCLIFSHVF